MKCSFQTCQTDPWKFLPLSLLKSLTCLDTSCEHSVYSKMTVRTFPDTISHSLVLACVPCALPGWWLSECPRPAMFLRQPVSPQTERRDSRRFCLKGAHGTFGFHGIIPGVSVLILGPCPHVPFSGVISPVISLLTPIWNILTHFFSNGTFYLNFSLLVSHLSSSPCLP